MSEKLTIDMIDDWYSWDAHEVYQLDEFVELINESNYYRALKRQLDQPGNAKVSKNTWIYSLSPATDCPHLGSERCQVPKESCYAYDQEKRYTHSEENKGSPLFTKRIQTVLWDVLDAQTFAETMIEIKSRKTSDTEVTNFRLNEAGDLRTQHDLHKINEIARILKEQGNIQTYLYSASSQLDWDALDERHFTLNASNDDVAIHADRRFSAKPIDEIDVTDNERVCPAELHGRDTIKCGECTMCVKPDAPDIYVPLH